MLDLGKVLQYQTEFFRNSDMGQWRYYELRSEMNPKNIDWQMFLGTEFGLAPDQGWGNPVPNSPGVNLCAYTHVFGA